mgnify:CR=1 FL=1
MPKPKKKDEKEEVGIEGEAPGENESGEGNQDTPGGGGGGEGGQVGGANIIAGGGGETISSANRAATPATDSPRPPITEKEELLALYQKLKDLGINSISDLEVKISRL